MGVRVSRAVSGYRLPLIRGNERRGALHRLLLDETAQVEAVTGGLPEALAGIEPGDSVDAWLVEADRAQRAVSGCIAALGEGCSGVYLSLRSIAHPSVRFAARLVSLTGGAVALELEDTGGDAGAMMRGLLGRKGFLKVLAEETAADRSVAVGCVDVDRLRQINLGYGHACGDRVLTEVTRRLDALLGPADHLARLGGDEFGMLLVGPGALQRAEAVAEALDRSMRRPILDGGKELLVTVSAGFSRARRPASAEAPLLAAEAALQRARTLGRCWVLFEDDAAAGPDPHSANAVALEVGLHHALEAGEFELVYQPIMDLLSERMVGVETLLRWYPADGKLVPPDQFVPVLEDTGLIRPVGAWVLRQACTELVDARTADGRDLEVTVNVSVEQLYEAGFEDYVARVLSETGMAAERLILEITEHRLVGHNRGIHDTLMGLRRLGVRLAVDDFGTGYSSLSYLRELPVQILKVDRSFVQGLCRGSAGPIIMHAIVSMATELGLQVIVEGIEQSEEVLFLTRWPDLLGQGYLLGRPVSLHCLHSQRWLRLRESA